MRNYHNIGKSRFRYDEYIGYAEGTIWRITRTADGWQARNRDGASYFRRKTLQQVSEALEATSASMLHAAGRTKAGNDIGGL